MSFVSEFTAYLKTRTDCPPEFHVHAAMAALAYAMGNKAYVHGHGDLTFPNLWTVIIAKSGSGKSVPLSTVDRLLWKAGLKQGKLPTTFSQEAVLTKLSEDIHKNRSIWILQEFSAFLGQINSSYNNGMMQTLTDLYDVPNEFSRTLTGGTRTLHRPAITILGASSPDWFAASFKESALRGGFLARYLFCPSDNHGEYVGYPGKPWDDLEASLAEHLKAASEMTGEFDVSKAQERWSDWDKKVRQEVRSETPPEFAGMRSRAGVLAWKAAMIMQASRNPYSMEITDFAMDQAIKYVDATHRRAMEYLSTEVAYDAYELNRLRVIDAILGAHGRISWREALAKTRLDNRQFKQAVETLIESEKIYVEPGNGTSRGWLCLPGANHGPATNGRIMDPVELIAENDDETTEPVVHTNGVAQTADLV